MKAFIQKIKNYCKLYRKCVKIAFMGATAYRFNFIAGLIITFCGNIMFPLVTILIYGNNQSFPNWSFWQVLLIQSIFTISNGISSTFFNGIFWVTNNAIREGNLEIVLIKPINPLFYMISVAINPQDIAYIIGGFIMFGLSVNHIPGITLINVLNFLLFGIGGILVMIGITLIMSATSFKWIGNSRIPEIFDSIKQFAKYPINIFPRFIVGAATFVVPVAMVAFIPAAALMNQIHPIYYVALIPCVIFVYLGISLYRFMIHLYESAGG